MRFYTFEEMTSYYASVIPDTPALISGLNGEKIISYAQLESLISERAKVLRSSGKKSVGILADGSSDCIIEIFAAARAGLRIVMLSEHHDEAVLRDLISYSDIDCLWGNPDLIQKLEKDPALYHAPAMGTVTGNNADYELETADSSATSYSTAGSDAGKPATGSKNEILFFTSGTTERAKGVVLTEASLMASVYNGSSIVPLMPSDRLLCMLPLNHVFGFICSMMWGLYCGASVALGRGIRYYKEDCRLFHPTVLTCVPRLWEVLVKSDSVNPELRTLLIGAGTCPEDLFISAMTLGIQVHFGYGLTEVSSGVAISTGGDPYSMQVCPEIRVTIAPDGEILVKAPTCMMQGYYKLPETTAAVLEADGTLHTGDLGVLDAAGKLQIVGRKKEIIILADGSKLSLPEYERECAEILGTNDVCAVDRGSQVVLVIAGECRYKTPEEVKEALRPVIGLRPRSQQVRDVIFRDEPLPRTSNGKLMRWAITV